jgi:hypothetical protein
MPNGSIGGGAICPGSGGGGGDVPSRPALSAAFLAARSARNSGGMPSMPKISNATDSRPSLAFCTLFVAEQASTCAASRRKRKQVDAMVPALCAQEWNKVYSLSTRLLVDLIAMDHQP